MLEKKKRKKKGGGQHLKKKKKRGGGHHRVLSTRTCGTDTLLSAANLLKGYAQDTHRLEMDLL